MNDLRNKFIKSTTKILHFSADKNEEGSEYIFFCSKNALSMLNCSSKEYWYRTEKESIHLGNTSNFFIFPAYMNSFLDYLSFYSFNLNHYRKCFESSTNGCFSFNIRIRFFFLLTLEDFCLTKYFQYFAEISYVYEIFEINDDVLIKWNLPIFVIKKYNLWICDC